MESRDYPYMKKETLKEAYYKTGIFFWCPCPYCKKMLIFQPKIDKLGRKSLKKWKKQKI